MSLNKILVVDFVNKKVTGAYEGPSGQTFVPITSMEHLTESRKRVTESIERVDKLLQELRDLQNKKED